MKSLVLNECDKTPVHTPSFIQPIGFMILTSMSFRVVNYAGNVPFALGLNKSLSEICPALLRKLNEPSSSGLKKYFSILYHDQLYDFAVHNVSDMIMIEGVARSVTKSYDPYEICKNILDSEIADEELGLYYDFIVNYTRSLSGFDRVMLYKFDKDANGEVVAEAKNSSLSPFLNHHFPSSDIPLPARAQYFINPVRFVVSASSSRVFLRNASNIDMSSAVLRGVADIHREYLRNMGVESSLSISIKIDGKLWGLIACHNYTKIAFTIPEFRTYELLSQIFSKAIAIRLQNLKYQKVHNAQTIASSYYAKIKLTILKRSFDDGMSVVCDGLCNILNASSAIIISKDKKVICTKSARALDVDAIFSFLDTVESLPCFYDDMADCALLSHPSFEGFGGLAIAEIDATEKAYLLLFRDEIAQTITWAGKPAKDETSGFLSPRQSFEAWQEISHGKALPFDDADKEILNEFIEKINESIKAGLEILEITLHKEQSIKHKEHLKICQMLVSRLA